MDEKDSFRLLKLLLDDGGIDWREQGGAVWFRLRRGGMEWETACRAQNAGLLFYGRYPFRPSDQSRAEHLCAEINRELVRGALFPAEDGTIVFRNRAELDDVYGADARIDAALRYNADVIAHYWGRMAGA